jgi:SAM-dependent methyltransferase
MSESGPNQGPRRLVFGEVAELYHRRRPGYPAALVDDLVDWAGEGGGAPNALEVGAGTGKATQLLAARGVTVLAIEPSVEMAAVARRVTEELGDVVIVESDFEHWRPAGRTFPLVYAAQAWHWVDQETGYAHAREALAPGGRLAAFWNRPAWGDTKLREALSAAYRRTIPDLRPDGPMHPDNDATAIDDTHWPGRIAATEGLADPRRRIYRWATEYTAQEYVELLETMSEVRVLGERERGALLQAVRETIEGHGDRLTMPMVVLMELARAV